MITKQIKQQQHMMMTALITILLAVFGSVQNAVGEVKVTQGQTWRGTTFVTVEVGDAGEFAKYLGDYPDFPKTYESKTTFIYTGKANSADLAALSKLKNERINLSKLKLQDESLSTPEAVINAIKLNSNAKYLALPDADAELTKSDDPPLKSLCDKYQKLKGVAYYYKKGKSYTCYSSVPGEVHILTEMTEDVTKVNGTGNSNLDIDNLKISGNVNAKDISRNAHPDSGVYYDENGHFSFTNEYHETDHDGYRDMVKTANGNYDGVAFAGSNGVIKLDLKDANFEVNDDMTLSKTGLVGDKTKKVVIPTSVENLPADFMHVNNNVLEEICIPRNIKKIGYRAFYGINTLNHVTTTNEKGDVIDKGFGKKTELKDFKDAKGNILYQDQVVTDDIDSTAGSVVFSENLTEIDSWAFASMYKVKDVYNLATTAPICQVNAFGSRPCTGNNGYSPNGGITRADYSNGGAWIAMLHYPNSIQGTDLEKRYTDVTRDYTISDADGNADGNGNIIKWPNHSEFIRSYQQATNGYLWKAWDAPRTAWNNFGSYAIDLWDKSKKNQSVTSGFDMKQEEANKWFNESTKKDKSAIFYHTSPDGSTDGKNDIDGGDYTKVKTTDGNQLYNGDYRGWHQFVLASSYDYESETPTPSHNFSYINDNGWWTICVPFKMNKAEVRKMFGYHPEGEEQGNPHVCELTSVMRDANADNGNGKIVLHFDRDVYNNVYDEKGSKIRDSKDDDDVIKAGVPYLLQPDFKMKSDGTANFIPSNQVLKDDRCKAVSQAELRSQLLSHFVTVDAVDLKGNKDGKKYYFIGNYWLTEMPQYAYFLAWYQPAGKATFFWQKEKPKQTLNWNAYTAIIGCDWSDTDRKFYIPKELGNIHWYTRLNNDSNGKSVFGNDSFEPSNDAKGNSPANISIEAAGNTTDGITKVHFGDRTIEMFHGKVYNLNGQYVGDSLEGLPKGIYIAAGKKYVVK